jgi:hypothetical protein
MSPQNTTQHEQPAPSDADELIREIDLYLRAVDDFRRAGCPPSWRPEH